MVQRVIVRALLGALLFVFLTAGCCVGPPTPVDGSWHLERTVLSASPGCRPPPFPALVIAVDSYADPAALEAPGVGIQRQRVEDTTISFVSQEWHSDEGRTLLVAHELAVQQDRLTGTAQAWGDSDDPGCRYLIDVVGTPVWE